jgi:hypothetical protein
MTKQRYALVRTGIKPSRERHDPIWCGVRHAAIVSRSIPHQGPKACLGQGKWFICYRKIQDDVKEEG